MPDIVHQNGVAKMQGGDADQEILKSDSKTFGLLLRVEAAGFACKFGGDGINRNVYR